MSKSVALLCKENDITIRQLRELTSIDDTRLLAIVMGRWTPSPQDREKIANALGVTKDDVTWGHVTPIQHIYGQGPS
ncbi:MAG: helix-turn-helix domain-containing protein [Pirellulaceae bacterium]